MQAYLMDIRVRVLEAAEGSETAAELAKSFAVSTAWVRRLRQRHRATGEVAPRRATDPRVPKLRDHRPRIRELLAATPDLTLVGHLPRAWPYRQRHRRTGRRVHAPDPPTACRRSRSCFRRAARLPPHSNGVGSSFE